jgi:hypothetical protein
MRRRAPFCQEPPPFGGALVMAVVWQSGVPCVVQHDEATFCWEANATGAGLLQADAALAATPLP